LIVSDQQGGIFRVDPDASPVEPELIAVVPEGMKDAVSGAQGLCWAFDSLYVVVSNGKPVPGLYRLRDTNGDDKLDHAELLRKLNGGGEHGPHAVVVAPDGSGLYVASGNHTHLPDLAGSKLPLPVAEDQLLPRMWDANGHAVNVMAPGGWICHVTPDGKEWTLVSAGYRNQYDIAFNHDGELFTFDSDMEWDIGLPWYRPTRVNHATSGSEFGWRSGSGKWPEYSADSLGAVVNVGPGSPTGVLFGYGAKFPAKYQNAFFIHDWSFGRIFAVHLTPDGSSYTGQLDRFITARPLPVTDMVIRPNDGALYFTTGGRGTQSGLYRVTYIGSESTEPVKHVPDAGQQARLQRHALEAFHGKQDPAAIDAAWPQLASPDRYMRYAARVAIEHQPVDQWASRALSETNPAAAIESLIALIHRGDKSLAPQIISALDRIAFDKLSEFHQLALLRAYGLTFIRMGNPDSATAARLGQRFAAMIPAKSTNLNMELARIVAFLQPADGPARLLSLLDAALTQEEQIHYVYCLRTVTVGWTPALRQRYFSWFASASQFRGGASFGKFLVNIRNEALAAAPEAMRDELKKLSDAKAQAAAPVAPVAPRPFVKNYTVDDLLPLASAPMKGRNFERGRAMYAVAQCAACHRLGTTGGSSGPDLTGVGGRMGPRDLLEAIIEPSKVVSDQYEATIFTLKGGNVIMGRIVNLSGDTLRINTNVFDPGSSVGVKQSDIVSQMVSPASLMPPGLLGTLTEEEVLDLLAYMISGGNPQDDMFR
jgi:putative heme-binding domain-containing protein